MDYLLFLGFGGDDVAVVLFLHSKRSTSYQYCLEGFFSRVVRRAAVSLMPSAQKYTIVKPYMAAGFTQKIKQTLPSIDSPHHP